MKIQYVHKSEPHFIGQLCYVELINWVDDVRTPVYCIAEIRNHWPQEYSKYRFEVKLINGQGQLIFVNEVFEKRG